MKVILFVENNHCGGMDTFFANLINNWPYPNDDICLICNKSHPGLTNIKSSVNRECEFIAHNIPLNWTVVDKYFKWLPYYFRRLIRPILRICLYPIQINSLKKLFRKLKGDRIMVVNGAYPGGESCRIASIAWVKAGGLPGVHNIRNFSIAPRPLLACYENWIDRMLDKSVHTYVGVSICCAESLRKRPTLSLSDKISYIYNGVSVPLKNKKLDIETNLRSKLDIGDAPMCLMLATYEARKGHAFLFEAFKQVSEHFPEAHLTICGDGTASDRDRVMKLQKQIAPNTNIHLLGFIPDGSSLIQQADILVVASQEWESFGWTVIEAMIRGVPVVSTNAGGLAEVIGPNAVAGFALETNDVESYAAAIMELLNSYSRRMEVANAGRNRALELFAVDRMVHDYAKLILYNPTTQKRD